MKRTRSNSKSFALSRGLIQHRLAIRPTIGRSSNIRQGRSHHSSIMNSRVSGRAAA